MKRQLLFLAHRLPFPPDKGERIRAWHVIQHLRAAFDVHLGCVDTPAALAAAEALRPVCASLGAFPVSRPGQLVHALRRARPGRPLMPTFYHAAALRDWVDAARAHTDFDVIYIYTAAMAPYVLDNTRTSRPRRLILDAVDIDSEKWRAYAAESRLPTRAVWAREARTLLAYERRAAAQADITLFVSPAEASRFAALAPECAGRVTSVQNGVDLQTFHPAHRFDPPWADHGPACVFTGHMDYRPNAEAAIRFARETLPLIRAAVPDAEFWIVGANPTRDVQALASLPGVRVTGRVPDTRPYLAHATVCVCPLRIARGIQNKVLEAMAMGRPVVASPASFEGIEAEAGRDLLVAEGASAVIEVLRGYHAQLGACAREAMEARYAWGDVLRHLDAALG